jgi:hypothetical protein
MVIILDNIEAVQLPAKPFAEKGRESRTCLFFSIDVLGDEEDV